MKKTLALAAAFGATALLATAPVEAQTPGKRGGIFMLPTEIDPANFDCQEILTIGITAFVKPVYAQLVRYDQFNFPKIVGDLAESWTVSPDGMTYTFKVRPNVKFHDGSPVTAQDIKVTYDRIRFPPQGILSIRGGEYQDIVSIETPDPMTVAFKLSTANAAFLDALSNPLNCVYSARKLAENPTYPRTEPMGAGPFVFTGYRRGSDGEGKRFDGYFRPGLPYLDGYKTIVFSNQASVPAMSAGQVDAIFRVLTPQQIQTIRTARGDKVKTQSTIVNVLTHTTYNLASKPFDDVRVRRALDMMLDRKEGKALITRITNQATDGGVVHPLSDRRIPEAEMDKLLLHGQPTVAAARAEAKRLLAEAGQSNIKVKLFTRNVDPWMAIALYVQDQWRKQGLTVDLDPVEQNIYLKGLAERSFDVAIDTNSVASDDPTVTFTKFTSPANNNYGNLKDAQLDAWFLEQKGADPVKRKQLVQNFERRMVEQAYIGPLFWAGWTVPLQSYVHNWVATPSFYLGYDLTEVWKE